MPKAAIHGPYDGKTILNLPTQAQVKAQADARREKKKRSIASRLPVKTIIMPRG